MGLVAAKTGTIRSKARRSRTRRRSALAQAGIAFVPEDRRIFPNLTVGENLRLAALAGRKGAWTEKRIYEYFAVLGERRDKPAKLSGGEQQMLAIARALVANPDIILLDEPMEGLAPLIARNVEEVVRNIRRRGPHDLAGRAERARRDEPLRPRLRALERPRRRIGNDRGAQSRRGDDAAVPRGVSCALDAARWSGTVYVGRLEVVRRHRGRLPDRAARAAARRYRRPPLDVFAHGARTSCSSADVRARGRFGTLHYRVMPIRLRAAPLRHRCS